MKRIWSLFIAVCLSLAALSVFGQDVQTKGTIGGIVTDPAGAAIPGAKITVTGPRAERTGTSNESGIFKIDNLEPGTYTVRVEQTGFKSAVANNVTVNVGRESTLNLKLETGEITATVDVTATVGGIDQQSTATGQNLNDQLFQNVPVQRGVSSLFYLSPGATDSINGGRDNPSVAGGSALDNLYVADGVNITNSAFGGIGTFSRSYGALGTGINTSFIKEVQVKTGGFEPQYGQSIGGIVNIITQSGGNEYHGAIYGFARPSAFEATRRQPDDSRTNKQGNLLHEENYDVGADVGGYVPGLRNKLFFFGSFNPTMRREIVTGVRANESDIAAGNEDVVNSGLFLQRGEFARRYRTYNYAGKLDWVINQNHQLTFSIFGDPTKTNLSSFAFLNIDNNTADSVLDYGTRNWAFRYNGSLSNTWTLNSSFSQGRSTFNETGFADFNQIAIRTPIDPIRGNYTAIGRGFFEPTESTNWKWDINTAKIVNRWGQHTIGVGYTYQRSLYSGSRERSGPRFPIPSTNVIGTPADELGIPPFAVGQLFNVQFRLRQQADTCTLCPLYNVRGELKPVSLQVFRGEFGPPSFDTRANYNAGYVQDTWRINKYVTALVGLRTEQERLIGSPNSVTGDRYAYSFTGQYAPRLGVTVDPTGNGNIKLYYNYGRFFEFLPLDAAERSLSQELDFTAARFAPAFTVNAAGQRIVTLNEFGAPIPVIDAAHLLSGAEDAGGLANQITVSASDLSAITAGTKLGFQDEHIFGADFQLPKNFVLSVRYQYRNLKRVVEDMAVLSPEAANANIGQTYFIGNPSSRLDAATNLVQFVFPLGGTAPAGCTSGFETEVADPVTNVPIANVCFASVGIDPVTGASVNIPDGIPDGFPDPVRKYRAFEFELNKRFSDGWQLLSNFRVATLRGNYEGHLRNDNGQTDPGISSLFDFTAGDFNLLGDQFQVGYLNTDRRFVSNIYASYGFSKDRSGFGGRFLNGLNLGMGFHMESGVPISEYLPHPVYLNAGEIPVGGRGKLGRTPFYAQLDLHADYPWVINERARISFIADFFNVTNNRRLRLPDQFRQLDLGEPNPDFLQPSTINLTSGFHLPFSMRLGARFEF
ncbi:MAG TPA: carboxypeptidase regulatory-like domain-containing protein [Pyrinomonadaceae bacterium]|nr:carboxypeptidase regulatory-like domain-containing protein [Pyrinomonadaceae bacterium]